MDEILGLMGMLLVLGLVLVASYYSTRMVGKYMSQAQGTGSQRELSVLRRLPLGRDQNLLVVKMGQRHLLLGCTPQQINLLTELTPEESQDFAMANPHGTAENSPFTQLLHKLKGEQNNK